MVYAPVPTSDYFGYATAVAAWQAGNDPINVATIPLQPRTNPGTRIWATGPGFVPGFDFNPQGGPATYVYNFMYWQYVDVIVALGGEFGIPSPGWINAAHLNGVQILGSVFTYHTPVYDDFVQNVLASDESMDLYAQQLATMAQYYGFDGWFLDIEPQYPDNIQTFLQKLTAAVADAVANPLVMFYTPYNSSLDSQNSIYFEVPASGGNPAQTITDALFLDYGWDEQSLADSANYAKNELDRSPLELFAGINVPADGVQFDAWNAVQTAVQAGVSAALWGTTWPFNSATPGDSGRDRMDLFWLGPADQRTQPSSGIAAVLPPQPVPPTLPFCTSFNTGRGMTFTGASWSTPSQPNAHNPWSNVGLQDVLPSYWGAEVGIGDGASNFSWELTEDVAYDGGASLLVSFEGDAAGGDSVTFNLFSTAFAVGAGLDVQMVVGAQDGLDLALGIVVAGATGVTLLVPSFSGTSPFASVEIGPDYSVAAIVQPNSETPGSSFTSRVYSLPSDLEESTITNVFLLVYAPSDTAAIGTLGRIAIAATGNLAVAPEPVQNLAFDPTWQTNSKGIACLNTTLTWDPSSSGGVRSYDVSWINVNGTQYWLGRVTAPVFVVSDLAYDMDQGSASTTGTFVVQAIGFNGAALSTTDSAQLEFTWVLTTPSLDTNRARLPVARGPKQKPIAPAP